MTSSDLISFNQFVQGEASLPYPPALVPTRFIWCAIFAPPGDSLLLLSSSPVHQRTSIVLTVIIIGWLCVITAMAWFNWAGADNKRRQRRHRCHHPAYMPRIYKCSPQPLSSSSPASRIARLWPLLMATINSNNRYRSLNTRKAKVRRTRRRNMPVSVGRGMTYADSVEPTTKEFVQRPKGSESLI